MAALFAIVIGAIVLVVGLILALKLIALALGLAVAVGVYFLAEKLVGKGR